MYGIIVDKVILQGRRTRIFNFKELHEKELSSIGWNTEEVRKRTLYGHWYLQGMFLNAQNTVLNQKC